MTSKTMLMLATTAAMLEQFNKSNIELLWEMGYTVHVAGNFKEGNPISDERLSVFKNWIEVHNGKCFHIPSTRKPTDLKGNYSAYKQVLSLISEYKYEFIHCHTPIGSVIGRLAAHKTKTKIIYTAHGFHFYDGAPTKNWLLYYPVEKFLSSWTDALVLINTEDYNRAKTKFKAKKTYYVPGIGIDTGEFDYLLDNDKIKELRNSIGVPLEATMLLSVGELNENKNHKVVIEALNEIDRKDIHYVIAGRGHLQNYLMELAEKYGLSNRVHILGFRNDIKDLLHVADIFLLPSLREGLNVSLMETMASGLPCICGDIRGNRDLIDEGKGGYRVTPNDVGEWKNTIEELANDNDKKGIGDYNKDKIKNFRVDIVINLMKKIYFSVREK